MKEPPPLLAPDIRCVSVGLDGKVEVHYTPPIDTLDSFENYKVWQVSTLKPLLNPTAVDPVNTPNGVDIFSFNGPFKTPFDPYLVPISPTQFPLQDFQRHYFYQMVSFSGCSGDIPSAGSNFGQVIELNAAPNPAQAQGFPRAEAVLTWNGVHTPQRPSFSHYEIYYNDAGLATLQDPTQWFQAARTTGQTFTFPSTVCSDYVYFRVAEVDTMTSDNGLGTFSECRSFSLMDSLFMVSPGVVPPPTIDTIETALNGDVTIKVNDGLGGSAETYEFYDITGGARSFLGSVMDPISQFTHVGAGVNFTSPRDYRVVAIDKCAPSVRDSTDRSALTLQAELGPLTIDTCQGRVRLDWNPFTDANGNVVAAGYVISFDTSGQGNFIPLITLNNGNTVTHTHIGVASQKTYLYRIEAIDAIGNTRAIAYDEYTVPDKPSEEQIPPPELTCIRVEANGDISLDWIPPVNLTGNFDAYIFEFYEVVNGTATLIGPYVNNIAYNDNTFTFTKNGSFAANGLTFNGQTQDIEIRAYTRSKPVCVPVPLSSPNSIRAIAVDVTVNAAGNVGDVTWNQTGKPTAGPFTLYRDVDQTNLYNTLWSSPATQSYNDVTVGICDEDVYYAVESEHVSGCISRSNVAVANYKDATPPGAQDLNLISYNRNTGEVEIFWSTNSANDVDSLIVASESPVVTNPITYVELGREEWIKQLYRFTDANMLDSAVDYQAQAIDACGNIGDFGIPLRTMDVDVQFEICDSVNLVTFNRYINFPTGDNVRYFILRSVDGGVTFEERGSTNDTVFLDRAEFDGLNYIYQIRARNLNGTGPLESFSNLDSVEVKYPDVPLFNYFYYATVEDNNSIEVACYIDNSVPVGEYIIMRGLDRNSMQEVGRVPAPITTDSVITFTDRGVEPGATSYFYRIEVLSPCVTRVDTTNFGRSIHLKVKADHAGLKNVLSWNPYEDADSAISHYNIYRGVDGVFNLSPHAVVTPSGNEESLTFEDDIFDELLSKGEYCYYIEGVQGPVNPNAFGNPNTFTDPLIPATPMSNSVCINREPLFYVPNAFSPDGLNRVFRPEGQFIDFALYEMVIYNRWGEVVYETRDFFDGWDGEVNGKPAQSGSYIYMIRFQAADGKERRFKGSVTIIR